MQQYKKKLRIAILTLPLHTNYGGILQAYALSEVLRMLGGEVTILNCRRLYPSMMDKCDRIMRNIIKKYLLRRDIKQVVPIFPSEHNSNRYTENIKNFFDKHLNRSANLFTDQLLSDYCVDRFDACVVGSDQVWRPCYVPNIATFFLRFLEDNSEIVKISYAASFGVDKWELNTKETLLCKALATKFNAVSVREGTAVEFCRDYLGIHAEHVLDPTLLLSVKTYISLLEKERKSAGDLFAYILDNTPEKTNLVQKVEDKLHLKSFNVRAVAPDRRTGDNMGESSVPPVEDWIMAFRDAEFVVTDSFHGCVFSIIFNKPFLVIGNEQRGIARFKSLLSLFELEDRLLGTSLNSVGNKITAPIDWANVNLLLAEHRQRSLSFLKSNLFS